ncbi:hypothetical protein ACP4OV_016364 [Aristida adscensionis]
MTFHFINAHDQTRQDGVRIVADCCEYYADPAIVKEFSLHIGQDRPGPAMMP